MDRSMTIATDVIGTGDDELGALLMRAFLNNLAASAEIPGIINFMNAGVKLLCAGSEVLEPLDALEVRGVELRVCQTCLDFYGFTGQLQVGSASNMARTVESMMTSPGTIFIG